MLRGPLALFLLCLLSALSVASCNQYDPPPDAVLVLPEGNKLYPGDKLIVRFSESVLYSSVKLSVWPSRHDEEDRLISSGGRLIGPCDLYDRCEGMSARLSEQNRLLEITFDFDNREIASQILNKRAELEIHGDLSDLEGNQKVVSQYLIFTYDVDLGACGEGGEPVIFESGFYFFYSLITKPIKISLHLIYDMAVDSETGIFYGLGSDLDPTVDNDSTQDFDELAIDWSQWGFTVPITGCIKTDSATGERYFTTEPFDFSLTLNKTEIDVVVENATLSGVVSKDSKTGLDRIDGTLLAGNTQLIMAGEVNDTYVDEQMTFYMLYLKESPWPDTPLLCSEPPCAGYAGRVCELEQDKLRYVCEQCDCPTDWEEP